MYGSETLKLNVGTKELILGVIVTVKDRSVKATRTTIFRKECSIFLELRNPSLCSDARLE